MLTVSDLVAGGVDGDYNDDGVVDAADYVMWRKHNGTNTDLPNDPNPVPIDNDQYNTWRSQFGESGPGAGGESAVPEPASCAPLFAYFLAAASVRRCRRCTWLWVP
jgi:hypothetical protein